MARNLSLTRGRLYFAEFAPNTQTPGAERFVGNCSEVTINSETEKLDHFASTHGVRVKDDSIILENTRTGTITTDDLSDDNVSIYSLGIAEKVSIAAGTTLEENFTGVAPGDVFQLGTTNLRPEGLRKVTTVVVTDGATPTPVTYVLNTDYVLDADRGRITILDGGAITDGDDIEVTYGNSAYSISKIAAGFLEKEGRLRWVSDNPKGPQRDYMFPWAKLAPNGDLNLVSGEDWATLPISVEILEKDGLAPWYVTGAATTA